MRIVEVDSIPDKNNERGLLSSVALFLKSQQMWTLPEDKDQFFPGRSPKQTGSPCLEWKDLASRFFENVYDSYWISDEYLTKFEKKTSNEIRVVSKDIKLTPGESWRWREKHFALGLRSQSNVFPECYVMSSFRNTLSREGHVMVLGP